MDRRPKQMFFQRRHTKGQQAHEKIQHQNMYIIQCETDHQPRLDAWDKCSGLVHWENPEGWGGEGGGRGDQDGEHM